MTIWFLCKIQYVKQLDNDKVQRVSEEYLIDAVSFTDAETRLYKCISSTVKDFNIISVRKTNYRDVFNYEDCETWYKCKMTYVSVDEGSGREKKVNNYMLISAGTPKEAYERLEQSLSSMIVPFDITDVNLTAIVEVFPYMPDEDQLPANLKPVQYGQGQGRTFIEQDLNDEVVEVEEEILDEEVMEEDLLDGILPGEGEEAVLDEVLGENEEEQVK